MLKLEKTIFIRIIDKKKLIEKFHFSHNLMHGNVSDWPPFVFKSLISASIDCRFVRMDENFESLKYPFNNCSKSELYSPPCISRPSNEYHRRDKNPLHSETKVGNDLLISFDFDKEFNVWIAYRRV